MRKLPTKIAIQGNDITIVYHDSLLEDAECHGDWDSSKNIIRINTGVKGKCNQDVLWATLFHEIIHAALDLAGHGCSKDDPISGLSYDEGFVERLAQALWQAEKSREYD